MKKNYSRISLIFLNNLVYNNIPCIQDENFSTQRKMKVFKMSINSSKGVYIIINIMYHM